MTEDHVVEAEGICDFAKNLANRVAPEDEVAAVAAVALPL